MVNDEDGPGCEKLCECLCVPGGDDRLDDGLLQPAWKKTSVNDVSRHKRSELPWPKTLCNLGSSIGSTPPPTITRRCQAGKAVRMINVVGYNIELTLLIQVLSVARNDYR